MSGAFEGTDDGATGALIGRAIAPDKGAVIARRPGGLCLNCGTALIGDYCHECGQSAHVHRTVGSIFHDLLHGAFHFEGKIWHTLPLLVGRPGALTRRYIDGERARFVSPLAIFLFFVFVMYALVHVLGGEDFAEQIGPTTRATAVAGFTRGIAEQSAKLDQAVQAQRTAASPAARDEALAAQAAAREEIASLRKARAALAVDGAGDGAGVDINTGWAPLDEAVEKAKENPSLLIYKLQANAYKFAWALIPISVPFVALLFLWRRRFTLYDHAIFVTYSLDFMMLLAITLSIVGAIGISWDVLSFAAVFGPPVHLYKQLRGAYGLRRFSAFWRMVVLIVFGAIALVLFFLLLLALGLMG